jgi:hexosaminidase
MLTIPKINGTIIKNEISYSLKNNFTIHAGDFNLSIVDVFLQRVQDNCHITGRVSVDNSADIKLSKEIYTNKESYAVEIGAAGINLSASDDAGMTWALVTLYQMLVEAQKQNDDKLPGTSFKDWPKYAHRGLMVDVCRHFFDVQEMKKIIEEMSINKLNVLHWHLTEDQAWRIESKVYPKLNEISSRGNYYTHDQIRDIVSFAADRGVEIIPEIDMPGHTSAAIAAYPELSCLDETIQVAENPGVYKVIMCAGKESTYEWIYQVMDEIVELFPSHRIHLGGDEAPKAKWEVCPHCNAYMEKHKINDYEELQGVFTGKITDYLTHRGKNVICWNDSLKSTHIPTSIAAQYWIEMAAESYVYPHFENGRPMIFSDVFHMYFDYPYCIVPLKKTYEYEPKIMGNTSLKGDNILGIEGAIWTERVPTSEILEAMISPRIQALAEAGWTVERDYEDFLVRLKAHFNELGLIKLMATPFEQATISGEEAKTQALGFMQAFIGMLSNLDVDMGLSQEELKGMAAAFINNVFDEETAMEVAKSLNFM